VDVKNTGRKTLPIDNDIMYQALRDFKIKNGLPLDGLDPMAEVLEKRFAW
jgi:hypothetical protein